MFWLREHDMAINYNAAIPLNMFLQKRAGSISLTTQQNIGQLIRNLFSNSEQGFAYDINDLSTLFQDAAGTTPVTAAGQPVGLVLDKSKGLVVGPERLTNGDFGAGSTGWAVVGTDATHIVTFSNGTMRYQGDTSTPVLSAQQLNTLIVGKWYEVTMSISNYISGALKSDGLGGIVLPSSVGTYKLRAMATSTTFNILRNTPNVDITIDSISVRELVGNHAYQTTSASRPLLQRNATTGAYYLAFDGTDDFLVTNSIDFTATDKISLFAGVRKLSDATIGMLCEFSADLGSNNGVFYLGAPATAGNGSITFNSKGTSFAATIAASVFAPVSVVVTGYANIAAPSSAIRVNGVFKSSNLASQGSVKYGNYPLYIGRRGGTTLPFSGHIYSLIGIGRLTTDAETLALEKSIAKNTGVTLSV